MDTCHQNGQFSSFETIVNRMKKIKDTIVTRMIKPLWTLILPEWKKLHEHYCPNCRQRF